MRSKLLALLLGFGLLAAAAPTLACPFTSASNDGQQQTAQAQSSDTGQSSDKTQ
jgi:hypothetical protein